jgi:tetratricopeptide (TPR) repeat protein
LRTFHQWYNKNADRIDKSDENDEAARRMFDEDLDTLHAYSLIKESNRSPSVDDEALEMHALVQLCTRVWLKSSDEANKWEGAFIGVLAQELPIGEYENWKQCEKLLPHANLVCSTEVPRDERLIRPWAIVLTRSAWYVCLRGNYHTAHALVSTAVAAQGNVLSLDDWHVRESISVLVMTLHYQQKFEEAAALTQQVLEWQEKKVVSDCDLSYLTNMADTLGFLGKCEDSEDLYRRAPEQSEKELGPIHPSTLATVTQLANITLAQSKLEEADHLSWRALRAKEKELGSHHPHTLLSMSNLAWLLCRRGKYEESTKMARRAWQGREKELRGTAP